MGFPANEFGAQEPGSNDQIATFCKTKYGASFDMFGKVKVKGDGIDPLFDWLTSKTDNPDFGGAIKWNFNKFLNRQNGSSIAFEPQSGAVRAGSVKGHRSCDRLAIRN